MGHEERTPAADEDDLVTGHRVCDGARFAGGGQGSPERRLLPDLPLEVPAEEGLLRAARGAAHRTVPRSTTIDSGGRVKSRCACSDICAGGSLGAAADAGPRACHTYCALPYCTCAIVPLKCESLRPARPNRMSTGTEHLHLLTSITDH